MLEDLFDLFERDKKHSNQRQTGLRGRLSSMFDGERESSRSAPDRARTWHDDDDDRDDSRRSDRPHKKKRDFDLFDFGD